MSKHKRKKQKRQEQLHQKIQQDKRVGAIRGRLFEEYLSSLLQQMLQHGELAEYTRHEPYSPEDQKGKDFTIVTKTGNTLSFGVTISLNSFYQTRRKHPHIPCLYFPVGTSPETIVHRIRRLIDESDNR